MKVHCVPCLKDNFAYILEHNGLAAVVDPVENIIPRLNKLDVKFLLTTHHHWDHQGGNEEFLKHYSVPVIGNDERIPHARPMDVWLDDLQIKMLKTPCHTTGSVCYFCSWNNEHCIFTGDTLFQAGCGRFFEGTAKEMLLNFKMFSTLPKETKVYCGHDYLKNDLNFAKSLGFEEPSLTLPLNLGRVMEINPFFHCEKLKSLFNSDSEVEVMARMRELKNSY